MAGFNKPKEKFTLYTSPQCIYWWLCQSSWESHERCTSGQFQHTSERVFISYKYILNVISVCKFLDLWLSFWTASVLPRSNKTPLASLTTLQHWSMLISNSGAFWGQIDAPAILVYVCLKKNSQFSTFQEWQRFLTTSSSSSSFSTTVSTANCKQTLKQ